MTRLYVGPGDFERVLPDPPANCQRYHSGNDTVFDYEDAAHPVRWRFGKSGKIKAFVVYRRDNNGWSALPRWHGILPFETHLGVLGIPE